MNRKIYVISVLIYGILLLGGCTNSSDDEKATESSETFQWKMVTAWPKDFPGIGIGANNLAQMIEEMSGGRITVKVYGAGELVGALEIFDAVSRGVAEIGHGASYYWKGKSEAAQFFASVPFGLTAQELNGWVYYGGGLELWTEIYDEFNLVPLLAGNTDFQMGGWFNKAINSISDIEGLKMRIPGVGGDILKRAGGIPILLPGGEIFQSLQSGVIDATEWVGPYNDIAIGLNKVAKYYYYPGWHEPGTAFEAFINKDAFNALPDDLKAIVTVAAKAANLDMLSDYVAQNAESLKQIIADENIEVKQFPEEVMLQFYEISEQIYEEKSAADPAFAKVYNSFRKFREDVWKNTEITHLPYMNFRKSVSKQ